MTLDRRSLLGSALTLSAMTLFPQLTRAQARKLVFATFTGSWEEAHRDVLVPAFRKSGNEVLLDPMLSSTRSPRSPPRATTRPST